MKIEIYCFLCGHEFMVDTDRPATETVLCPSCGKDPSMPMTEDEIQEALNILHRRDAMQSRAHLN